MVAEMGVGVAVGLVLSLLSLLLVTVVVVVLILVFSASSLSPVASIRPLPLCDRSLTLRDEPNLDAEGDIMQHASCAFDSIAGLVLRDDSVTSLLNDSAATSLQ